MHVAQSSGHSSLVTRHSSLTMNDPFTRAIAHFNAEEYRAALLAFEERWQAARCAAKGWTWTRCEPISPACAPVFPLAWKPALGAWIGWTCRECS
jgi:hypothetical protein